MTSTIILQAQELTGDGNVVRETKAVSHFEKIEVNGTMSVYLKQGETESVVVEADKNLIPYFVIKVKGDKLSIGMRDEVEIEESTKQNVYVTLKDLTGLEANGVGNIESENTLNLDRLNIENNSVGNLKLDLKCNDLKAEINSVGSVIFSGNAGTAAITHNGVGNLKAFDLSAGVMKISSNAVGNCEVSSSKEIYIDLNGIGNISYKGNPVVKALNENGLGKVKKL